MRSQTTGEPRRRPSWFVVVAIVVVAGIVLAGLVRGFVFQTFVVPTASMEPTIHAGERIGVWRPDGLTGAIDRGDVVVIDGRGSFLDGQNSTVVQKVGSWFGIGPRDVFFVKRVIGTGGDTVSCCDAGGRLEVNGQPVVEPYVQASTASEVDFTVEVPLGRVWLMGDNRTNSTDSRNLLGKPGGGMIRTSDVLGVVVGHGSSIG